MKTNFEDTVKRVYEVNEALNAKGFEGHQIDKFWLKIFSIQERVDQGELDLEDVKICTGCGRLNIEGPVPPPAMACCPDSNYKTVIDC